MNTSTVNLQIFNRLIEKKIELYILSIQEKLKHECKIESHSWISFLYGEPSKFSIIGYLSLFYQYIFPNIVSSIILLVPFIQNGYAITNIYLLILFIFAIALNVLSYIVIFIFISYFSRVRKKHYNFYISK